MSKTILVVDDKTNVRKLLREYLTENGYRVLTAEDGQRALYAARHDKPDLILLDVMMPEMDGHEFMRAFRKESNTPIILLTAKLEESDKVLGLELGADDYITKPFGVHELVARIRAVLRRVNAGDSDHSLRVADVSLDKTSRRVFIAQREIFLTRAEFDLLALFLTAPARVFTRLELMEHLQGPALEGVERTINVHIRNLRSKIENDPARPRYIETVFGVGYRFRMDE